MYLFPATSKTLFMGMNKSRDNKQVCIWHLFKRQLYKTGNNCFLFLPVFLFIDLPNFNGNMESVHLELKGVFMLTFVYLNHTCMSVGFIV